MALLKQKATLLERERMKNENVGKKTSFVILIGCDARLLQTSRSRPRELVNGEMMKNKKRQCMPVTVVDNLSPCTSSYASFSRLEVSDLKVLKGSKLWLLAKACCRCSCSCDVHAIVHSWLDEIQDSTMYSYYMYITILSIDKS